MTPFELSVLLHYYSAGNDFRDGDFSAPIFITLLPKLIDIEGLIEKSIFYDSTDGLTPEYKITPKYKITDRGRSYIEYLLNVPLPTMKWVIE